MYVLIFLFFMLKNNLERSEFEAKHRTKTQVEALEREINKLKRNLKSTSDELEGVRNSYQVTIHAPTHPSQPCKQSLTLDICPNMSCEYKPTSDSSGYGVQ